MKKLTEDTNSVINKYYSLYSNMYEEKSLNSMSVLYNIFLTYMNENFDSFLNEIDYLYKNQK